MDSPNHGGGQANLVRVVVNKDEKGYGMKVSGDYPVYVQSVKEGMCFTYSCLFIFVIKS